MVIQIEFLPLCVQTIEFLLKRQFPFPAFSTVLPALAGFHVLSQFSDQLRLEPDGRKDRFFDFVLVHPDRRAAIGAVPCPGAAFIIGPYRLFMHWSQSTNAAFQFSIK